MNFVIEPAQTLWGFDNIERTIIKCTLRVPPDTKILGFESNHLLLQYPVLGESEPVEMNPLKRIELIGIQLGVVSPKITLADCAQYLGALKLGERFTTYCVFQQNPEPVVNFNGGQSFKINQEFRDADPERIARVFAQMLKEQSNPPKDGP